MATIKKVAVGCAKWIVEHEAWATLICVLIMFSVAVSCASYYQCESYRTGSEESFNELELKYDSTSTNIAEIRTDIAVMRGQLDIIVNFIKGTK